MLSMWVSVEDMFRSLGETAQLTQVRLFNRTFPPALGVQILMSQQGEKKKKRERKEEGERGREGRRKKGKKQGRREGREEGRKERGMGGAAPFSGPFYLFLFSCTGFGI